MKKAFLLDKKVVPLLYDSSCVAALEGTENLLISVRNVFKVVNCRSLKEELVVGEESGEGDNDNVPSITAMCGHGPTVVTANSTGAIEVFDLSFSGSAKSVKSWKTVDNCVISCLILGGDKVIAGFTDGSIRIYDLNGGFCTHNLKGAHGAAVSALAISPKHSGFLYSAAVDGTMSCFDVSKKAALKASVSHHSSSVTSLCLGEDVLLSCSRDGTVTFYDLTMKSLRSIPTLQSVESCCSLGNGEFAVIGDKGSVLKISINGLIGSSPQIPNSEASLNRIFYYPFGLVVTSTDHMIYTINGDLAVQSTFVGNLGEITDMAISQSGSLVVASGDSNLKIFESLDSLSCRLLRGHSANIVCLSSHGDFIVTGSRDCSFRIWTIHRENALFIGLGHTDVVSAVALTPSKVDGEFYVATGSSDLTIKLWRFSAINNSCQNMWTIKAHEKDINALCFLSNHTLLSGSQDKSIRTWSVEKGAPLQPPFKGHRRGIWSLCRIDSNSFASGSSDKTIKIWSLSKGECIKSLEGHENSVLRIQSVPGTNILLATDSDGLIRLWDYQKSVCLASFDEHLDRLWSLSVSSDAKYFVAGDSLGVRTVWRDATTEIAADESKREAELILEEQALSNLILRKEYSEALGKCLAMDLPGKTLYLIQKIAQESDLCRCLMILSNLLKDSSDESIERLVKWAQDWNSNFKRSLPAMLVIKSLFMTFDHSKLKVVCMSSGELTQFIERHYRKLQELITASHMVDLALLHL